MAGTGLFRGLVVSGAGLPSSNLARWVALARVVGSSASFLGLPGCEPWNAFSRKDVHYHPSQPFHLRSLHCTWCVDNPCSMLSCSPSFDDFQLFIDFLFCPFGAVTRCGYVTP